MLPRHGGWVSMCDVWKYMEEVERHERLCIYFGLLRNHTKIGDVAAQHGAHARMLVHEMHFQHFQ